MAAGYSREEMERMQADAIRRVHDMQQRAQRAVTSPGGPQRRAPAPPAQQKHAPPRGGRERPGKGFDLLSMLNLKSLDLDNDTLLILMVLLILSGDCHDELLLLALIYIIL